MLSFSTALKNLDATGKFLYPKAKSNLDRVSAVVTDSTPSDGIIVEDLAEEFRLQVGMWKDNVPRPAVDSMAVVDSVPPSHR